jgi:Domain of unknown function (DUF4350)
LKQKLFILLVFVLMAAVLAALSAASYSQRQKEPESEMLPNRSSYNYGPTGTQAFYSLLSETGRRPLRWQEPIDALERKRPDAATTFVMVGPLRRDVTEAEIASLMRWVSGGGRLVIIDRDPPDEIVKKSANWNISGDGRNPDMEDVDPSDQKSMTRDTPVAKPSQPSVVTYGVNAVQPSRFASTIDLVSAPKSKTGAEPQIRSKSDESWNDETKPSEAVIHLMAGVKGLLADVHYGKGRVVILSDPYIVANGGISLVDNAQLAVNIVSNGGPVAFDEYHQGFGANQNRLAEFFAGTPVIAIFFQCLLIVGLLFFSQSRRFGRPLPAAGTDRLSKLEYIGAMAELQQRTRAYDLAIENIYREFRRRAARLLGVDNMTVKREQFAVLIADKAKADRDQVDELMFKCEEIIAGAPVKQKAAVELAGEIRRLEQAIGLRRRTSQ